MPNNVDKALTSKYQLQRMIMTMGVMMMRVILMAIMMMMRRRMKMMKAMVFRPICVAEGDYDDEDNDYNHDDNHEDDNDENNGFQANMRG